MKYYLIGIKGSGMSALASLLFDLGHLVIGSDEETSFGFEESLRNRSINILVFNKNNINDASYIYIIGNAYTKNHLEVQEVIKKGYQYIYYHDFISTLKGYQIAVSGTHGKTTTTKMLVDLLPKEELACIIGDGTGFASLDYKYLVYEACEYQQHFLSYYPDLAIITNIEWDHPDYYKTFESVQNTFEEFKKHAIKVIDTYKDIEIVSEHSNGYILKVNRDNKEYIFDFPFCGRHMVNNFNLVYQAMIYLGFDDEYIISNINNISLPKRRNEELIYNKHKIIIDYGHHPTEIKAIYNTIKQKYPNQKITVIFQGHTYSRMFAYLEDFKYALNLFDIVYIANTFTSIREPFDNDKQKVLNEKFKDFLKYEDDTFNKIIESNNSIILVLGAGDLGAKIKNFILEKINENK